MKFTVEIDTHNDAFNDGNHAFELRRILLKIAGQISDGRDEGAVLDINGAKVGEWALGLPADDSEDDEPDEDEDTADEHDYDEERDH